MIYAKRKEFTPKVSFTVNPLWSGKTLLTKLPALQIYVFPLNDHNHDCRNVPSQAKCVFTGTYASGVDSNIPVQSEQLLQVLYVQQYPVILLEDSDIPDKTVVIRRLSLVFAVRKNPAKYFLLARPK